MFFKQDPNTNTVTRRQKAIYSTQGGLSDAFVEQLGLDVGDLHRAAIQAVDRLNKATHVRPETLMNDEVRIKSLTLATLTALEGLIESFSQGRSAIKEALIDDVYRTMSSALIEQTFDSINILAGKGYEVAPRIGGADIEVEALLSQVIVVRFSGIASVTLHYGSKHDVAEINHDFPFWFRFEAPVKNPTGLAIIAHHFDDSSWFS